MPRDTKVKTTKRKTEAPKAPTSDKTTKIDTSKELRNSAEKDLNFQLRIIQQQNDDLLQENRLQKEKISMLERKLELEEKKPDQYSN